MKVNKSRLKIIVLISVIVIAILTAVGVAVNATGSASGIAKSVTFSENMDGYYVYFRAVDEAGNAGDWSNAQRIWIDTTPPIVTAKQESVTIKQGEIYLLKDYFTVEANGSNEDIEIECTINGEVYEDTESLTVEGSPYTVICTASKNGGNSNSDTMEIIVETAFPVEATVIQSKTTEYKDSLGNTFVVPGGFKVLPELATTVDKGIVIEDSTGNNQFVWVPIGTITKSDGNPVTIEFGRYSDFSLTATPAQYAKDGGWNASTPIGKMSEVPTTEGTNRESKFSYQADSNATALNLEKFITTSITNGGYYIARYEASFGSGAKISSVTNGNDSTSGTKAITNQIPYFKQSKSASSSSNMGTVTSTPSMLWNYIRQGDASLACQNLYAGNEYNGKDYVQCDLVNSYAWDTAIMFIQKCSEYTTYWDDTDGNGTLYNTGETIDNPCNIYDMKGNLREWTTEYSSLSSGSSYYSCVYRGGDYNRTDYCAVDRSDYNARYSQSFIGFRGLLYCNPVS